MKNLTKLVYAGLFAAIIGAATMVIKIPIPNGYIHPGDGFILLAGIFLGPIYGGLAAGIGSAVADIIGGYTIYAPATFIIKWACASIAYLLVTKLSLRGKNIIAGIFAELFMVFGYFIFELVLYKTGAFAGIPYNLIQGAFAVILATILHPLMKKILEKNKS